MYQLTTACICAAADTTGNNTDNLLFAGQILPEKNGGLNGTPALRLEAGRPFLAAVFTGIGAAAAARKAAYAAASVLKNDGEKPVGTGETLRELLSDAGTAVSVEAPGTSVAVMAASIDDTRISLAGVGACHAYLMRGKALYLLSGAAGSASGLPGDISYSRDGKLRPGDQLLLCTDTLVSRVKNMELLKLLAAGEDPQESLKAVVSHLSPLTEGTITAILVSVTE